MEKKRYDAFISYRHCETDSFVAKTLEKKLETLKLPKNIQSTTNITKIDRIFRDEDELPVATNLSDQIEYALKESEYLICLCSPRYLESKWCMKEIETFIGLYGREKILLVLVDGEPNEAFPELLTKEDVKEIDENGNEIIKTRYIEPLAADVRGKDNKERKKKIEDTTLRLSAAMLGINYDDLKQRHRERKLKQTMSAITVAFVCMLIFSLTCLGMLLRIQKQSLEIQAQSDEIQKQSNEILKKSVEIEEKNVEIESQYNEISTKYAITTASNCLDLIDQGRKADAIYALRNVLPDSMDDTEKPYTPEAHYMLSCALDLYPKEFTNYSAYEFTSSPTDVISNGKDYVAVVDESKFLYVFNLNDNRSYSAKLDIYTHYQNNVAAFVDDDNIVYQTSDKTLVKYNVRTNKSVTLMEPEPESTDLFSSFNISPERYVFSNPNSKYYIVSTSETLNFFEKSTDNIAFTINVNDYLSEEESMQVWTGFSCANISDNDKYLAISFDNPSGKCILCLDVELKKKLYQDEVDKFSYLHDLKVYDDGIMYSCATFNTTIFKCIDLKSGKKVWERDDFGLAIGDFFHGMTVHDVDCLTVISYDKFLFIDKKTGETIFEDYMSTKIAYALPVNSTSLFVLLEDGDNFRYLPEYSTELSGTSFSHSPNMKIDSAFITDSGLIIVPNSVNYISFYKFSEGVEETQVYELNSTEVTSVSDDFKYYITREREEGSTYSMNVYELETNKRMLTIKTESGDLAFIKDDSSKVVLLSPDKCAVYNIEDASKLFSINAVEDYISTKKLSNDKTVIYSFVTGTFRAYSLTDGRKLGEITFDDYEIQDKVFVVGEKNLIIYFKFDSPNVEIYDFTTGELINSVYVGADYASNYVVSDDGKYLYVNFPNGTRNFYALDEDLTKVNSLYVDYADGDEFRSIGETDMYLVDSFNKFILLNKDLKPISYYDISNIFDIDTENKVIYLMDEDYDEDKTLITTIPYYDYDDLIRFADEYLGDYYPSESTREQFNILQ